MVDQIAKRYTDALVEGSSTEELVAYQNIFKALATSLEDEKVKAVFFSPYMKDEQRTEILLDAVKAAKSDKVNNIVKLLVEKRRVDALGAMAKSLALLVADQNKSYEGKIYSNTDVKKDVAKKFETNIGDKVGAKVSFETVKNEYNGVKLEVEDLGVEVSFSKSNVRQQMIQHILKSI